MKSKRNLTAKEIEDILLGIDGSYLQRTGKHLVDSKEDSPEDVKEKPPVKWYDAFLVQFKKAAEVAAPTAKVAQTGSQVGDDVPNALPSLIPKSISSIVSPFLLSGAGLFIFVLGLREAIKDLLDDLKEINDAHEASNNTLKSLVINELKLRSADEDAVGSSSSSKKTNKFIFVNPEFVENLDFSQYSNTDLKNLRVKRPYKKILKSIAVNSVFIIGNAVGLAASSILLTLAVTGILGIVTAIPAMATTVLPMFIPSIVAALSSYGLVQAALTYYKSYKKQKLAKAKLETVYDQVDAINMAREDYVEKLLQSQFDAYQHLKEATEIYDQAAQENFEARREFVYSVFETLVSVAVFAISTVVFAAALGALGGVSFGAIPSALILSIAGAGAAIKIFQLVDDMGFNGRLSKKIDTFFEKVTDKVKSGISNAFGRIFGKKPAIVVAAKDPGPGPTSETAQAPSQYQATPSQGDEIQREDTDTEIYSRASDKGKEKEVKRETPDPSKDEGEFNERHYGAYNSLANNSLMFTPTKGRKKNSAKESHEARNTSFRSLTATQSSE